MFKAISRTKEKIYNLLVMFIILLSYNTNSFLQAMTAWETAEPYTTTPGWIIPMKSPSDATLADKIDLREYKVQRQSYSNRPEIINDRIGKEYAYLDTWEGNITPLNQTQLNYVMGEEKAQPVSRNPLDE